MYVRPRMAPVSCMAVAALVVAAVLSRPVPGDPEGHNPPNLSSSARVPAVDGACGSRSPFSWPPRS